MKLWNNFFIVANIYWWMRVQVAVICVIVLCEATTAYTLYTYKLNLYFDIIRRVSYIVYIQQYQYAVCGALIYFNTYLQSNWATKLVSIHTLFSILYHKV